MDDIRGRTNDLKERSKGTKQRDDWWSAILRDLTATVRLATQAAIQGVQNRYLHLLKQFNPKKYGQRLEHLRKSARDR